MQRGYFIIFATMSDARQLMRFLYSGLYEGIRPNLALMEDTKRALLWNIRSYSQLLYVLNMFVVLF